MSVPGTPGQALSAQLHSPVYVHSDLAVAADRLAAGVGLDTGELDT